MKTKNYLLLFLFLIPTLFMGASNNDNFNRKHSKRNFLLTPTPSSDEGIKGKFLITAGVGLNVWSSVMQARYTFDYSYESIRHKGTPMFHFDLDYGLLEKFSVGVSAGYQKTDIHITDYYYYSSGSPANQTFSYTDTWERLHLSARADYHIVASANTSLYTGLKLGYNEITYTTTFSPALYPNYYKNKIYPNTITIQAHMGFSYYFNERIGFNTEVGIGIGGPYIGSFGIAAKI